MRFEFDSSTAKRDALILLVAVQYFLCNPTRGLMRALTWMNSNSRMTDLDDGFLDQSPDKQFRIIEFRKSWVAVAWE